MLVAGRQKINNSGETILQARGLKKHFPVTKGLVFVKVMGWIKAVDGIDFTINRGETFGLVGESGCGKTTTSRVILLEEKSTGGHVLFNGEDIGKLAGNGLATYRRLVQAVFQDPYSSLNPRMKVSDIISEPIMAQGRSPNKLAKERVAEVLNLVGLSQRSVSLYPHEFSGGQRQRIAIARALAPSPQLIVLDEPVSALDVSIRAQILNLFRDLQERLGLTYFFIAHDLAAVKYMSTQIGVMYLGKLVESGESNELYTRPIHPYTQALLASALPLRPSAKRQPIAVVKGEVPSLYGLPDGCRFHPRCPHAIEVCSEVEPPLKPVGSNRQVACHLSDKVA